MTKVMYQDTNVNTLGLNSNSLFVSDIFATIQGEMPFAGRPAVFLRLAGCNRGAKESVACNWCDTDFRVGQSKSYTMDELVEALHDLVANLDFGDPPMLVITGGEPMLHSTVLLEFIQDKRVNEEFISIQFETNGDLFGTIGAKKLIAVAKNINEDVLDQLVEEDEALPGYSSERYINFVISPKRAVKNLASAPFLLEHATDPGFFIRLVVSGDPNSPYYSIPETLLENWPADCFYLSPITVYKEIPINKGFTDILRDIDVEATRVNVGRAVYLASKFGLKVSLQAHSYIGVK